MLLTLIYVHSGIMKILLMLAMLVENDKIDVARRHFYYLNLRSVLANFPDFYGSITV